ncbi:MAG: hypothetical protein LBT50_06545 [Prevotellaceae bacterium]|jgi:hypothetical protein|nr:hypothetical protein [Prevotellaceae bacterium]
MAKTGKQIQGDVMETLSAYGLPDMVTGGMYRAGYRPRDSRLEDIIVIFTTGVPEQIQTGIVTINIYCPDLEIADGGGLVENGRRCEELEIAAAGWVDSLTVSDYRFTLQQTIYTENDAEIHQHFVVIKLKYEFLTF